MRSEEGTTIGGSHSDCHSPYSPFGTSKVKGSGSRFLQLTFPLRFMYMPDEESYRRLGAGFLGLELGAFLDLCLQKSYGMHLVPQGFQVRVHARENGFKVSVQRESKAQHVTLLHIPNIVWGGA